MNNPIGIHAGVWVGDWSAEHIVEAVSRTKEAGFDLIEVTGSDPNTIDAAALRAEIERAGLSAAVSLGLTFDADVNTDDRDVLCRGRSRLQDVLRLAADVGASHLVGCLYSALGKYPGPSTSVARTNAVESVRDLADAAADRGIGVGLEVVNRYESNLFNTAEQALSFIDDVDRDNVSVHLDTYHMNIEEGDVARPVALLGDRLGYVHIGESHRGYLGSGTIDWPRFFRALASAGYAGPITFESFSSAVVDPMLSNTLAVWRDLWTDNVALARHARSFIDVQLTAAGENVRR